MFTRLRQIFFKKPASHLVFAQNITESIMGFLEKESRHFKAVKCYVQHINLSQQPNLSKNITLYSLDTLAEAITVNNRIDIYRCARTQADYYSERIKKLLPDFFLDAASELDLENIYKYTTQFKLAIREITFIQQCMDIARQTQADKMTFCDINFVDAFSALLKDAIFSNVETPPFHLRISNNTNIVLSTETLRPEFQSGRKQLPDSCGKRADETSGKSAVLALLGADVQYSLIKDALEAMAQDHQVFILLTKKAKLTAERMQELESKYTIVRHSDFIPSDEVLENISLFFNTRAQQIKNSLASKDIQNFLHLQLIHVLSSLKFIASIEALIQDLQPAYILGCLEKNAYGPVFSELKKKYNYHVINFQHGIMPHTWSLDRFDFDTFFIWNPLARQTILNEGYGHEASLKMVGNPSWEGLSNKKSQISQPALYQEILDWKGSSPLLGAYTQHQGDYLTRSARECYIQALLHYLEEFPTVKLLIKKHPSEKDCLVEDAVAKTCFQDRVRIFTAQDLPLWDSFQLVDLVTSICSTVLIDALLVQAPVLALDFENIIGRIGYGFDQAIPVIQDSKKASAAISQILLPNHAAENNGLNMNPDNQELIYPSLSGSYAQRVHDALQELNGSQLYYTGQNYR